MKKKYKPNGYWTKERCHEEALKYDSKKDFKFYSKSSYQISYKNGWLDEICSHMKKLGNLHKRCIYVYEFSDNHVYVGLTYNIEKRHKEHLSNMESSVYKYLKSNNNYTLKKMTEYIDIKYATIQEQYFIDLYENENWIILNRIKGGALGKKDIYWTKERCQEESLKYITKKDFRENSWSCYQSSIKYGYLDNICQHMIDTKKPPNYWTKDNCEIIALKYNYRKDFNKNSSGAYLKALKNGWLNDICSHMNLDKKPNGYWTREKCQEESLKYDTKKEFKKHDSGAYKFAYRNGYLNNICSHMKKK